MSLNLIPFIWVFLAFPILLLTVRWIHTHLHGVALLLTGKPDWAVMVYALALLPGVFLHETSHWVTAKLLGVRTAGFSLIPRRQADGSLQLGYVEYYKDRNLGAIRESLVGGAPLIVGTAVILLIGFHIFDLPQLVESLQSGDVDMLTAALGQLFQTNDFLVWLYLIFAVANAMMPSASDRRAWPAFLLIMGATAVVLYLLGLQGALLRGLAEPATVVFGYLGLALSMAIAVNLFAMMFIAIFEAALSRLKGQSVVYGSAAGSK